MTTTVKTRKTVNAKLVKTRSANVASSSLADWYIDKGLYQAGDEFWAIEVEYNTMGHHGEFPALQETATFELGSGKKFPSKYRAANELLGYGWSEESVCFKETHKTWGGLLNFTNKVWEKVDSHLKPSLEDMGISLVRTNETIDFEGQMLKVYHTGTETMVAVAEYPSGSKFIKAISNDSRGFMRWSDQHSVNVYKEGWKIKLYL